MSGINWPASFLQRPIHLRVDPDDSMDMEEPQNAVDPNAYRPAFFLRPSSSTVLNFKPTSLPSSSKDKSQDGAQNSNLQSISSLDKVKRAENDLKLNSKLTFNLQELGGKVSVNLTCSEEMEIESFSSDSSSDSHGESKPASVRFCEREVLNFEKLKNQYSHLFSHPQIKETKCVFPDMPDIEMDEPPRIIAVGKRKWLGTSGVCNCISVCARGKSSSQTFLALAHLCLTDPQEMLEAFMEAFEEAGCTKSSIEIYLVGGVLPAPGGLRFKETEEQFIKLSEEYPIKGILFNTVNENSSIDVVLGTKAIYFRKTSTHLLFDKLDSDLSFENLSSDPSDNSQMELCGNQLESSGIFSHDDQDQDEIYRNYYPILTNEHIREGFFLAPTYSNRRSDEIEVVYAPKGTRFNLGTRDIGAGIALCARGLTTKNQHVLAIAHISKQTAEKALSDLMQELSKVKCYPASIYIYLVGGNANSLNIQNKFLTLSKKFPIVGAKFNLISGKETLDVMIDLESVQYQKNSNPSRSFPRRH